jgi:hypothetical protein
MPAMASLLFSALPHPDFNPEGILFVISGNLNANIFNFNYLIKIFRCAAPMANATNIYLEILWCSARWTLYARLRCTE